MIGGQIFINLKKLRLCRIATDFNFYELKHIILDSFSVYDQYCMYTVMQSDRNSSKTDTFHEPTTYTPHV